MKKFAAIYLLCLCCSIAAFAQKNDRDRDMNKPVAPFRIIGNVYYVGASDVTSYLITTPQGHILIDAGFEETVPQIQANVTKLGFKLADVKILLINHAHYDHCGGMNALKKLTHAKLYASPPDVAVLEDGGMSDFYFGGDKPLFVPVKVDQVLRDHEEIKLGGTTLTTYYTFGHTKGATSWTMDVVEGGKVYKVVFTSSLTKLDYDLIHNKKYPGIAKDFTQTFKTLHKIKPDVFLGSHGQFFDLLGKVKKVQAGAKPNPFIDPKGYAAFIDRMSNDFEKELRKQRAAGK